MAAPEQQAQEATVGRDRNNESISRRRGEYQAR